MRTRDLSGLGVCWIGNMRYTNPLSLTDDKKWRLLGSLGLRMYVVGFAVGLQPRAFARHARFYLLPELPAAPLRYLEFFLIVPLLALWLVFRRNIRVIVATSPFEGAIGALVKNVARLVGRRVALVVESHGDFELAVFQQRRVRFTRVYTLLMSRLARYGLRHADVLRAVSGSTRRQLEAWTPAQKPLHQFMTWSDFGTFSGLRRELPVSAAQTVLYAGTLIPRKGVHVLIEAFARAAGDGPAELWLVGKAENFEYTRQLQAQVERCGLAGRVKFIGAVSQTELADYMGRARALVLVSQSEGLPRVVIEAMMTGLVVIASHVSGIPEVIEHGSTGYLVPPDDVEALAAVLRQVLLDPHADVIGARAQAYARQFFSEAAYVEGYQRLLAQAARAAE
ncbi:MAG: glycosyltransferase [Chloroflexi bacterium]|nr:glycosyltransferase [Chloroflexota bacterium]